MKLPTLFISHGGGPWPWLYDFETENPYSKLAAYLKEFPKKLEARPKAIIIISAHWEESQFTAMTSAHPPMVYDYFGFPKHTTQVKYAAPGAAPLVPHIKELMAAAGMTLREDPSRGYDHGTFVPLFMMFPEANIPVLQLSMKNNYDPIKHIKLGQILAPLRDAGVLIIGSGHSYHNLNFSELKVTQNSQTFDAWLTQTLCEAEPAERIKQLVNWSAAPLAQKAHPKADHLVPLFVAAGASPLGKGQKGFSGCFPLMEGVTPWEVSCFEFWG